MGAKESLRVAVKDVPKPVITRCPWNYCPLHAERDHIELAADCMHKSRGIYTLFMGGE
jgi:hypothetical protein